MASNRLTEETTFELLQQDHGDLCEVGMIRCKTGGCEFIWIVENEDGDSVDLPAFCPKCGRRA